MLGNAIRWMIDDCTGRSLSCFSTRVQDRIRRQQEDSEVLIGALQFLGVTVFTVLYYSTPMKFPKDAAFEPVPIALSVYGIFTLIRIVLALRRRLPTSMVVASVILDMAVLLTTIWSFHIQYRQPAEFSLKSPTMLYIFFFIALRTLRFEASYVMLAGATAILGWATLVAYAFIQTSDGAVRTHSYVEYIRGEKILLGGEVDKLLTIAMVTAVLAVVQVLGSQLLLRSITEEVAAGNLSRFFSPEVARQIATADQPISPGHGVSRRAAILYTDLRGFTVLTQELSADDIFKIIADYQSRLVPIIQKHGGSIDKFLGDGIMATYGAAVPTDTYAADAVRAVLELQQAVADWNALRSKAGECALNVGMSLAAGPVIFGAVGDQSRLEYTVIGDAVNLAAKLEKHTKVEAVQALASSHVLNLAHGQGLEAEHVFESRKQVNVAGVSGPMDVVVLSR